ncbi:hypothetical protein [uncultured Paraglaciecola sp.]|uniref:hypothetical protein n=1 Tax=uncultured Paraglaciecola sp. TaxID=1765024 RepID=UPI002627B075|nr:hypothetical protein [uncultured Paraglaciecola sp.]
MDISILNKHEKLIKAVFKNQVDEVNDCLESDIDISANNNEALRIAELELYSAKSSVIRNEAIVNLLRSKTNG